jgi:hypothetical protein
MQGTDPRFGRNERSGRPRHVHPGSGDAAAAAQIVYDGPFSRNRLGGCLRNLVAVSGMRLRAFETVAARMLVRDGVEIIWQLHLRAAASDDRGSRLSALALIGIADTAERLWRTGGR